MRLSVLVVATLVAGSAMPVCLPAADRATSIQLSENDISDRPYHVLGDLKVVVRKQTLLSPEPTRERVDRKLRREAHRLGADAVVLVRYGTIGMGVIGWGELEGRGRAIRFD